MTKKIPISAAVILVVLAIVITFQLTHLSVDNKYKEMLSDAGAVSDTEGGSLGTLKQKLDTVDEYVRSVYIGDIDEQALSDYIMRGYVAGLGDKYANYLDAEEFATMMEEDSGNMVGIGVTVIYNGDYAAIEIISVLPDSPAEAAGMRPGDLVVGVGEEDVAELGYYPAINKIKGEAGSVAELTVMRIDKNNNAEYIEMDIPRAEVHTYSVTWRKLEGKDIGVIRIETFDQTTPGQFQTALVSLQTQGVEKYIFDLRYNSGGELGSICQVLDLLLPEGPIIRALDKAGKWEQIDSAAGEWEAPMAVLVNEGTASAAELFSAALKDYNKATLVGTVTYGKGTMQTITPLNDGSAISVSTAMYYPPFSDNYEGVGVIPHIEVELPEEVLNKSFYKMTDEEDTQLQMAVDVLEGRVETPIASETEPTA